MPWGSLDLRDFDERTILAARASWTVAAFQAYRVAIGRANAAQGLLEAGAPVDIAALASSLPIEALTHAELCARMAMELGGAVPLEFDRELLYPRPDPTQPVLVRALEAIVRGFCVGETIFLPLVRVIRDMPAVPLVHAIWRRIARDDAPLGAFGWLVLDWALPNLDCAGRAHLGRVARLAIDAHAAGARRDLERGDAVPSLLDPIAWMATQEGANMILRLLDERLVGQFAERGIPLD